jgi:hypothetical protein
MTVIVWDGKTLAADKLCVNNGIKAPVTKIGIGYSDKSNHIFRSRKYFYGYAGTLPLALELVKWLNEDSTPSTFPEKARENKADPLLLVIVEGEFPHKSEEIYLFEGGPVPSKLTEAVKFAIGSGRDIAYGAMAMGADAEKAVLIANEIETTCGLGVDKLSFYEYENPSF